MENVKFWKLSPAPVQRFKAGFLLEGNFTAENVEGCSRALLGLYCSKLCTFLLFRCKSSPLSRRFDYIPLALSCLKFANFHFSLSGV